MFSCLNQTFVKSGLCKEKGKVYIINLAVEKDVASLGQFINFPRANGGHDFCVVMINITFALKSLVTSAILANKLL